MKELAIPIAIVMGFSLVATALYVTGQTANPHSAGSISDGVGLDQVSPQRVANNRVYGNDSAAVTIVEFSDVECPFCGRLHPTLKQLVDESNGSIKWEYRHFPLPSHRNAIAGAVASECVAELAGNEAFWSYLDRLFVDQTNHSSNFYATEAISLGVDANEFNNCMQSQDLLEKIQLDIETARALGARGTPFSVIVKADGSWQPVSGALPYAQWQQLLVN